MDRPQRLVSLDTIRGLSILGILIVNALDFAQPLAVYSNPTLSPVPLTPADGLAFFFVETFAREKFVTLFSLLFGASLFLVGEGDAKAPLRRLIWLTVFGLIHGALIWHGDILLLYALTGLIFLRWRDWPAQKLLITGVVVYGVSTVGVTLLEILSAFVTQTLDPPDTGGITTLVALVRSGFMGGIEGNFQQWAGLIVTEIIVYLPVTLGLMMIGLGLFKSGFLKGEAPTWVYGVAVMVGAVCLVATAWMQLKFVMAGYSVQGLAPLHQFVTSLTPVFIALGYASLLMLLLKVGPMRLLLYPLQCAGKMAFTNYLVQSLVMTSLFFGGRAPAGISDAWGLPWFGQMNLAALMPIVVTIWIAQLIVSTAWMSAFRYGPFEWLWRSLTYQRLVSIRK
jgi:uncharacterized protein